MECKLCLVDRDLRNSHIIPEFLYTPLYDKKHRFHILASKGKYNSLQQKGLRERLLCIECEGLLNKYETYASKIFNGSIPVQSSSDGDLIYISGLNYQRFKLFGMSILWRAGVSQLQMFSKVSLGPHQEKLRKLVLDESPGHPNQYGFFLSPLVGTKLKTQQLMAQPTKSRLDGSFCYRFLFGGIIWVFIVSSHKTEKNFADSFLSENGDMRMLETKIEDADFLFRGISAVKRNALQQSRAADATKMRC